MARLVENERLAVLFVAIPWSLAAIQMMALALSLLPVREGFWLPSDPLMRIATAVPWGRLHLLVGAVCCFAIGGVFAYWRKRFED